MNQPPQPTAARPADAVYCRFDPSSIKAVTFDMQGSLLDFYTTIVDAGSKFTAHRGIDVDWTDILNSRRARFDHGGRHRPRPPSWS
ncbi:MAG: hypothetical protein ABW219_07915, partial [Ilumatobacteraceae bacterium]